jgi:hypothetical protein
MPDEDAGAFAQPPSTVLYVGVALPNSDPSRPESPLEVTAFAVVAKLAAVLYTGVMRLKRFIVIASG